MSFWALKFYFPSLTESLSSDPKEMCSLECELSAQESYSSFLFIIPETVISTKGCYMEEGHSTSFLFGAHPLLARNGRQKAKD